MIRDYLELFKRPKLRIIIITQKRHDYYLSLKVMKPELKSENTFSSRVMALVNHKLAFTSMKARILMNFPPKVRVKFQSGRAL